MEVKGNLKIYRDYMMLLFVVFWL